MSERDVEINMLREFFRSWVALHLIPKDKLHRRKQEAAAQLLVDNAHALKAYYKMQEPAKPRIELVQ